MTKIKLHPIPKDIRSSSLNSENYRGIVLSSIIGKLFDCLILLDNEEGMSTSYLQFGFKAGNSKTKCTCALLESVNYYKSHDSSFNLTFDSTLNC